jgi:hypothetical protein
MPLEDILRKIHKEFGDDPGIDSKSTADELISFIEYIVPEYDDSRVYPSDVKKLVNWYNVLLREFPDFFKEEKKEKKKPEEKPVKDKSSKAENRSNSDSFVNKKSPAKKKK